MRQINAIKLSLHMADELCVSENDQNVENHTALIEIRLFECGIY